MLKLTNTTRERTTGTHQAMPTAEPKEQTKKRNESAIFESNSSAASKIEARKQAPMQFPKVIGNWLVKRSTDQMTDKVSCTAFYSRDSQIQLNDGEFFIGLRGRGGVRGITLRFGENPPHSQRLATDMEKRISSVIFSRSEFAELQNSTRLRVQVLTVLDRVWEDDIDLRDTWKLWKS